MGFGLYYDVNATDISGLSRFWLNNTSSFNIDPNTGEFVNTTALGTENYFICIYVNDTRGNTNSKGIMIVGKDDTPPEFTSIFSEQVIEAGNELLFDANATDLAGLSRFWVNNTINFQIEPTTGLISNKTELGLGKYWLMVFVNDTNGNIQNAELIIRVEDTISPNFVSNSIIVEFELGEIVYLDLNATDFIGLNQYWLNSTEFFIVNPVTGELSNSSFLTVNNYWLQLLVNDTSGNSADMSIYINVKDTVDPEWNEIPVDQTIDFASKFQYKLNATDLGGIELFSVNDTQFEITENGLLSNATELAPNIYMLEIIVVDSSGNNKSALIAVTVVDDVAPTWIEEPQDQTCEFGTDFLYNMNATDLVGIESFNVNDSQFEINENGVLSNANVLLLANYFVEITVFDKVGNNLTASFTISVIDTKSPMWIEIPEDLILAFGEGLIYDINASDNHGIASYSLNDTINFDIDSDGTIINLTTLKVGEYSLKVIVVDFSGNEISKTINITILEDENSGKTSSQTTDEGPFEDVWTPSNTVLTAGGLGLLLLAIIAGTVANSKRKKNK